MSGNSAASKKRLRAHASHFFVALRRVNEYPRFARRLATDEERIMRAIVLAMLAFGLFGQTGSAQELLTITVTADATKAKGSPWDGPPDSNTARIPLPNGKNPPDLAVCVIESGKAVRCELRRSGGRDLSKCQNSFTCRFDRISVPSAPFGLIVLDLDFRRHDLVDFAVVVPDSHPPRSDVETVEIEMHKQLDKLAPSVAESDFQRRQKDAPILLIHQCGSPCRLTQSEVRLERTK